MVEFGFYQLMAGSGDRIPTATVGLLINGELKQASTCGNGPIDALFCAVDKVLRSWGFSGSPMKLTSYQLQTWDVSKETIVQVEIRDGSDTVRGVGKSQDMLEASLLAYLGAVNTLVQGVIYYPSNDDPYLVREQTGKKIRLYSDGNGRWCLPNGLPVA